MYKHCVCKVVVLLYKPLLFSVLVAFAVIVSSLLLSSRYFAGDHGYVTSHFPPEKDDDVKMRPIGRNPDSGIREIFE